VDDADTPAVIDGADLAEELANLEDILEHVYAFPGSFSLSNIDIAGRTFPVAGRFGGDHVIFVDFKRRYDLERRIALARREGRDHVAERLAACRDRVGVLLADVAGHNLTDALLAAMLHQAFLVGVLYELRIHGEITTSLFEILNTRFVRSSSVRKYVTMVYGEIAEDGTFRFISAGHPPPLVYSREFGRFVDIDPGRLVSLLPVGMFPSADDPDRAVHTAPHVVVDPYPVNEVTLMAPGDVMLLLTDGVTEHEHDEAPYVPATLEAVVHRMRDASAAEILDAVRADMLRFAPVKDDSTLVVVKRRR
jgi:serine phosphatase RsbU (regulator of sigma subunit)